VYLFPLTMHQERVRHAKDSKHIRASVVQFGDPRSCSTTECGKSNICRFQDAA